MKRVKKAKARRSNRLHDSCLIEGLESRVLLAADLVTWVGTTGNWNVAANWSANRVPNAADNVSIPAGADVAVSDAEAAAQITVAHGAILDVNGGASSRINFVVNGGLTNNGDLDIGAHGALTLKNNFGYTQENEGTLTLELGGSPTSGKFGQINSNGPFNLSGALQTLVLNTYTPTAGDAFGLISYSGVSGGFSSFSTASGGAFAFAPVMGSTGLVLIGAVDSTPPASSITGLASDQLTTTFTVNWLGSDNIAGSGVKSYSVFVSDNGGTFAPFQTNTSLTSASFAGVVGHTYGFYSVATDNAGNVQATPSAAQMTTDVDGEIESRAGGGIVILGTDGADTIRIAASGGSVMISRDGTNSSIKAGKAKFILVQGGAGADGITLAPSAPAVSVNGGGGADTIISKNDAANSLNGGAGADSITGGLGNELIEGAKGSNTLIAGSGNETLVGGSGADSIVGGPGADLLLGGGGLDTISAGSEDSTIDGNRGL